MIDEIENSFVRSLWCRHINIDLELKFSQPMSTSSTRLSAYVKFDSFSLVWLTS